MRRGRWIVAALVIALTGCEAGESVSGGGPEPPVESRASGSGPGVPTPGPTGTGSRQGPGVPTPRVHRAHQGTCDDVGAGQALRLSTADPAAMRILDEWDACLRTDTTPAYTWLHNRTRAVWTLRTTPWDAVQQHRPARTRLRTVQSGVFHGAAQERGKASNASAFILPGESLWIEAEPGTVSWQVDLPLTVAWAGVGEIIGRLDAHGQQLLTQAVARRGARPSVTVTCVLALSDYARNRTDLYRAGLEEVLRDGFEDLLADEDCTEAARGTTIGRGGRTVSVLEDILEVIPESGTTVERISGDLEPYAGVNGVITLEPAGPGGE